MDLRTVIAYLSIIKWIQSIVDAFSCTLSSSPPSCSTLLWMIECRTVLQIIAHTHNGEANEIHTYTNTQFSDSQHGTLYLNGLISRGCLHRNTTEHKRQKNKSTQNTKQQQHKIALVYIVITDGHKSDRRHGLLQLPIQKKKYTFSENYNWKMDFYVCKCARAHNLKCLSKALSFASMLIVLGFF